MKLLETLTAGSTNDVRNWRLAFGRCQSEAAKVAFTSGFELLIM